MQADKELNILAFGAGAIGSYIGGSLSLHGHRVLFLEREHNALILKKQGLKLRLGNQTHVLSKIELASSVSEAVSLGPFDFALFALKSYDTSEALRSLKPFAAELPPFLCLQNGVDNERALADVFGEEKVIAGTVTTSIGKPGLGEVVLERKRGIGLSASHPSSDDIDFAMENANLNPRLYTNADDMKWSKLLTNLLANSTCAILDMSPAAVLSHPGLFETEMKQLREAISVMASLGLRVVDLPGTPVRALAFAAQRLSLGMARILLVRFAGRGRGGKMPSLHIDLHNGKGKSEISWLNGAVSRWGKKVGVKTPVNDLLHDTLFGLLSEPKKMATYHNHPQALLDMLR